MRGAQLKEVLQGVHEQRLAEAPRPRDQQDAASGLHHRLDEFRLVDVVAAVPDHVRKVLAACSKLFFHGI